jgi:hypothetical protein
MEAESRKLSRRDIKLVVQIDTSDGAPVRGELLDLSEGAPLNVRDPGACHINSCLRLSDKLDRWSRIVWRAQPMKLEWNLCPLRRKEISAFRSY